MHLGFMYCFYSVTKTTAKKHESSTCSLSTCTKPRNEALEQSGGHLLPPLSRSVSIALEGSSKGHTQGSFTVLFPDLVFTAQD